VFLRHSNNTRLIIVIIIIVLTESECLKNVFAQVHVLITFVLMMFLQLSSAMTLPVPSAASNSANIDIFSSAVAHLVSVSPGRTNYDLRSNMS